MSIKLTIPEFSKLYREYANEVKENKRPAVDRATWKYIKGLLINNKRLIEVVIDLNYIFLNNAIGPCFEFHEDTVSGLNGFLDFIYEKNKSMNNLGSIAETKCNCADLTSITDWCKTDGIGNVWINDKITSDSDWNTGSTIGITDTYSELNTKIQAINKRVSNLETHNDEIFCQATRNADELEHVHTKINDAKEQIERQEHLITQHKHDIGRLYEDIGRHEWAIADVDNHICRLAEDAAELATRLEELSETVANHLNTKTTESDDNNKENNFMDMKFMNFDFGKVNSDAIRMSMYGLAIKNVNGTYVSYDAKNHSVMDVEIMNVPGGDLFYKMPVAIKDVKAGDIVIHNKVPMFVIEVHTSTIKVIDIREGTEKEIYLTKNMFGFNYATKVVSIMDMMGGTMKPSTDNPFGNIGMLMLMSGDSDMKDVLPMLMLSGNTNFASNPMLMYFMMKDGGKMDDMLPLMLMMNQPTATEQKM